MNPELVVLSSCNSAIGELVEGEGLTSLSKALFHSNAQSVVSTLWAINDESSSIIMRFFYQNLKEGMTKDKALRLAKLEYLEEVDPAYAHPYYWAGIIAMGDMSPVFSGYTFRKVAIIIGLMVFMVLLYLILRKKQVKAKSP